MAPALPSPAKPYLATQPGPWRALQGSYWPPAACSLLPSHWLTVHYLLGHTPLLSSHLLKTIINCHFKINTFLNLPFLNLNLPKMSCVSIPVPREWTYGEHGGQAIPGHGTDMKSSPFLLNPLPYHSSLITITITLKH